MDLFLIGAGVAGFATVMFVAVGVRGMLVREKDEVLLRVERAVLAEAAPESNPSQQASVWARFLRPLARFARPKDQSEDYSRMKRRLTYAGFRGTRAMEVFYGAKFALAALAATGVLGIAALSVDSIPNLHLITLATAAVAFYSPNLWLGRRITSRQIALSRSLPDALDLLITCLEAGLGLEAAVARITKEVGLSAPILATELQQTTLEIQAGVARAEAFRRLADRTGIEELRSLSAILIQTEMFGTSIAQALRSHASSMRTHRTHRAEERGATVAVKMLLPLILFILPSLFAIILGPAVVRIVEVLLPTLAKGSGQ